MNQNSKHNRSENLTDEHIEKIVKILDGWSTKLTWNKLIDEVEFRNKNKYTRQALAKHQRIKDAYNLTKDRVSDGVKELPNMSSEVAALVQKVKRLEAENERLNFENEVLLAQFARWAYNSHSKGVTKEMLDKPLTPVDRGATKV
jgi:type I restriction-modification system DNA methylase subunit